MMTVKRSTTLSATCFCIAVAGAPVAAPGFAGAGVDVAFVTPDGSVAVAGNMVEARVLAAIRSASETTGVAFPYLLAKAYRESGLDSFPDASSSSAAGIFQFTRQTWLGLFLRYGRTYGQGELVDCIARVPKRGFAVPDSTEGRLVLDLRHDPELAAQLAAEYTRENRATLSRALGRSVTPEELYIAHFLGAQGAVQLMRATVTRPDLAAASIFPDAAARNPGLFYLPSGRKAVSVSALHDCLVRAFKREMVRFATLSPEVLGIVPRPHGVPKLTVPRKPDRRGGGMVAVTRSRVSAEDLKTALVRFLLPGGRGPALAAWRP